MHTLVVELWTNNGGLKKWLVTTDSQLEDEVFPFHIVVLLRFDEKSTNIYSLDKTMKTIF